MYRRTIKFSPKLLLAQTFKHSSQIDSISFRKMGSLLLDLMKLTMNCKNLGMKLNLKFKQFGMNARQNLTKSQREDEKSLKI